MVFAEMPLSSKHWVVGSDATLGRAHAGLAVRADDLERRRLLVAGGAGGARRASEAERVVQRMHVPGIAVVGAAVVDVARDEPAHFGAAPCAAVPSRGGPRTGKPTFLSLRSTHPSQTG